MDGSITVKFSDIENGKIAIQKMDVTVLYLKGEVYQIALYLKRKMTRKKGRLTKLRLYYTINAPTDAHHMMYIIFIFITFA